MEANRISGEIKTAKQTVDELLLKFIKKQHGSEGNLLTGLSELDKITFGFSKGELSIIAGRPGMGKTALILQLALNMARNDKRVLFYSIDQSAELLMIRAMSGLAEIFISKIQQLNLTEEEHKRLFNASQKIAEMQLSIAGNPPHHVRDFIYQCSKDIYKILPEVIFIDYLQLFRSNNNIRHNNWRMAHLMRELKAISNEFNIAIIVASQLSRSVEMRGGTKRPVLSDLHDNGAIEQEVDKVIFIYRPEYYLIDFDEDNNPTAGVMELIVAKNRNGALDTVKVKFDDKFICVSDSEEFAAREKLFTE
jgi:replicative DNA helicase